MEQIIYDDQLRVTFGAEAVKLVFDQGLSQETAAKRLAIPKGDLGWWCKLRKLITHCYGDGVAVDVGMGSTLAADRNTAIDGVEIVLVIDRVVETHRVASGIAVAPDLLEGPVIWI